MLEMEGICNHNFVDDKDLSQEIESVRNKIRRRKKLQEDINGQTLLHYAAINGDSKTLAILIADLKKINNQSEVNRIDKDVNTPLHYSFNKDCIAILLKNRARIIQNKEGQAPIHCATIKNSPDSIEYYISYYIRMNITSRLCVQDKKGCTFFHYALKNSMNINYIKHIHNIRCKTF
ncbi:MAG: ankyrin repeat domain-containing protein [Wolbachia endosymbiont of Fragariocoptes setiger]|nr:ankyrin repeat domain-containing protein [Wolbachia endosymbiont of Fragariocoptes setiger]